MAQHQEQTMNHGPQDASLLYLQPRHISEAVWQRDVDQILRTRRIKHTNLQIEPPPQIIEYLRMAGFLGVARLGQFRYDRCLVSTLVERWRPETHTFHTTRGECTITLQDVAIQLGLPCAGTPIVGSTAFNWQDVCEWLLGIRPPEDKLDGQRLKMSWLEENFNDLPNDVPDLQVQQFTRAYILRLIGGLLMPDRSGNRVYLMCLPFLHDLQAAGNFSWGSAVLAHLYRELCNATDANEVDIGGCLALLHMWAWDRFPGIAPTRNALADPQVQTYHDYPPLGFRWINMRQKYRPIAATLHQYRGFFDKMVDTDIIWEPYQSVQVQAILPKYCTQTPEIWCATVPLLYFHIIELHHPDRVLRQFGRQQPIPLAPMNLRNYHTVQLRGATDKNWVHRHRDFLQAWDDWHDAVVNSQMAHDNLRWVSEYMQWYWRHTRRWISRTTCDTGSTADMADYLHRLTINSCARCGDPDCVNYRHTVVHTSRNILCNCREQRDDITPQPAPPATELPRPQIPHQRPSRRRRAYLTPQLLAADDDVTHPDQPYVMSPPSSSHEETTPEPSNYGQYQSFTSLFQNDAIFSSEYNATVFDQGGPSTSSFATPRQSVSLNDSQWIFNSASNTPIDETTPQEEIDAPQQRRRRPLRNIIRTRCGIGSHYL